MIRLNIYERPLGIDFFSEIHDIQLPMENVTWTTACYKLSCENTVLQYNLPCDQFPGVMAVTCTIFIIAVSAIAGFGASLVNLTCK